MKTVKLETHPVPAHRSRRVAELAAFGLVGAACLSSPAFAQSTGDAAGMLQNAADMIVSGWGKGIALLAVVIIGFTCMSGRLNIAAAFAVVLGIAIVFGAGTIVSGVSGGV